MIAYVGIGANLGDARANVDDAIERLAALPSSRLLRHSARYRSAPVDSSGDDYINAVACIDTGLSAPELLEALQHVAQLTPQLSRFFAIPIFASRRSADVVL